MDTKKKRTPNQKKKAIVSVLLMVAILITGAFAFLSATDSKTNVFTVGNVKIKLSEEFDTNQNGSIEKTNDENDEVYDASETQVSLKGEILPGQKVIKRPYVENTGKNKAWVYITVGIPTTNSNNTFRNKDTGETSITGQNVDIPIQAYAIQENYANKTTYKDVWNAYFADKITDTFGAEVTDAKTLSERVPLFEILNKTRFNEPIPDNISVDDNIPNDDWENIGITVDGQEKSYYKSANYDYYVFAYKTLLDPTADGAEQLNRTSDVFEGVRLLKDIGEAQPSKLNYYIKETAGNTLNGEVDLSVEASTYDGYRLVKTEYYMPGERVRNLYYDDTLAETGYSFNWNFMNDKTKSAYSGMTITQDTDLVATYKDTVSDAPKEPTEAPVVKYSPSGYLGYAIEQNDDGSYYATLIGADETRSDYPSDLTEVIVPSHIKVLENSDGTKLLEKGVVMHGSIDDFPGGTQIPVKKIQLAEWQWDTSTNDYAAPEAVALGKIAKKLNIAGSNIEEIKFCGDIYQHNLTSGFVLEDIGTLPSSLKTLNEKAFYNCVNLKRCKTPNSLTSIGNNAFEGCNALEDIDLSDGIISVGRSAFWHCDKLKNITLPNRVTSIGDFTFSYCDNLTKINIPNGVTGIGDDVFYNCTSLTNVSFPGSIKTIGNNAFFSCDSLTSVTIPDGVTNIGKSAFFGCDNLTSVIIPNSVVYIGNGAFKRCRSLKNITIPDSITNISDETFSECNLESITIPKSVTSIGNEAFACCHFTSITIPDNVTSIGANAFTSCMYLTSVNIPQNVASIEKDAFSFCLGLTNIVVDADNKNYASKDGILYTKDFSELLIYPMGNETKELVLPEGLKKIPDNVFENNIYIESIVIPSTVTEIGNSIISDVASIVVNPNNPKYDSRNNCNAIIETATNTLIKGCKNTIIPETVKTIGTGAFSRCFELSNITIPTGVINIKESAFNDCRELTSIIIPDGISTIEKNTFSDCSSLTNITLPNSVISIGDYAFSYCNSLKTITLPNSVISMGDYAFFHCESLTTITIPDGVTSIGEETFTGCNSLTGINIPKNVTSINNDAFDRSSLVSISVDKNNKTYDSRNDCNAIIETATNTLIVGCKNTVIPDDVTNIGKRAFVGCEGLTSIIIPNSVTSIGEDTFFCCRSLISVTIPNSVTSIGGWAFSYCDNLKNITYQGTVSDWAKVECPPGSFASGLTITCTDGTVTTQ